MDRCQSLRIRFDEKIRRGSADECWEWVGTKSHDGRGLILVSGAIKRAHRVSYELHVGEIPPDMYVYNRCGEVGCVRPDHLYLGYRGGVERTEPRFEPAAVSAVELAGHALNLGVRLRAEQPGVYVLFTDGIVVYVGQSRNVFQRVGTHFCDEHKRFDEWTYVVVRDHKDRLKLERELIMLHSPAYNKRA